LGLLYTCRRFPGGVRGQRRRRLPVSVSATLVMCRATVSNGPISLRGRAPPLRPAGRVPGIARAPGEISPRPPV